MIRFTKAKGMPKPPKRPQGVKKNALDKLNAFLTAAEPEAVEILNSCLQGQSGAITYKELRESYLAGGITQQQFEQWEMEYSRLVNSTLRPQWQAAAAAGAQQVMDQYPYFVYEPSVSVAMGFIERHGAEMVTNLAREQRSALNAVIAHVSGYTAVTPDEAARIIRPCIGLTTGQALANARYREAVKTAYLKAHPKGKPETAERRAADAAARYAARQHRYRAQNIARTELAYAYNAGHYGATKDAQAQGYIGDCAKMWVTAYDERVCPICSRMDEEKRGMDDLFSNGKLLPPGHPSCRCAVAYEEIPGTNLNPAPQGSTMEAQAADAQVEPPQAPAAQPERPEDQKQPMAELNMIINPAGKVVWLVDQSEVKLTGMPDSITQITTKNGGITRNYYGPDGRQTKQISNNDHGHKVESGLGRHGEHAHDYEFDENGRLHRGSTRELTDEERKENGDIL